jgi:peptide/nickel transport system permease protein
MIPILLGVSFIIFFIMNMIPGNVASLILGDFAPPEAIDRLNEELGLNEPFLFRYANYVSNALKGDFGYSYRTRQPVYDEIFTRLPTTLKLASGAIVLAVLIGATLGIISAVRQYSILDAVSSVSAMFISAIPAFWLGLLSILLFSLRLGLLPSNGADQASAFIMPVVTLSLPAAAEILRLTRSTMLEVIRQDYIRTAKAKGAPKNAIIFRHALKNAMFPIITVAGMHFGGLLGGSVITESVFAMPGVGTLVINAIRTKDTPQVMASVLLLAAIFCFLMLAIDLLYAFIDPRVRARYRR